MIWGQIYAEQAKLYERLLSLLRGAIKLSFLPLRIALPRRRYSCALILLGALGLLAFALSAISPDDDDFQHECIHRRTSQRPLVQAKKDFLSSHIRFHVSAAESVARPGLRRLGETAAVSPIDRLVCSGSPHLKICADRAPPFPN